MTAIENVSQHTFQIVAHIRRVNAQCCDALGNEPPVSCPIALWVVSKLVRETVNLDGQ